MVLVAQALEALNPFRLGLSASMSSWTLAQVAVCGPGSNVSLSAQ